MRIAVITARFDADPPLWGGQAAFGLLPGDVVGVAVGAGVGEGVGGWVGGAVRAAVVVGAAVVGATVGVGVRTTAGSVQATKVTAKSAASRPCRVFICSY